ncbi:VPLPA-CTERM sorting domain-containing protein [Roseobacter denitrificans]|uniref:Uncharacterized protein n=1 Tax=Roseobacter denitrificans (strain ATCC 33942 / OCh 114) TaxID=375451 RepID=Q162U2_ROSDO|nr:VPLPA-CTERM sorting domain-containing protein [Roseobacter denitrificans]ABG33001.1 hypothetical protein RD1_3519 [Roseobacter denitrificans OCh 114]
MAATIIAGAGSAGVISGDYRASSAIGSGTQTSDHSLWIQNGLGGAIGSDFDFSPDGLLSVLGDGTMNLSGTVISQDNANAGFVISFDYNNVFETAGGTAFTPTFKSENGSASAPDTILRNLTGGTMMGTGILAGLNLSVTRLPENGSDATQVGSSPAAGIRGANNKNENLGMANWFKIAVTSSNCGTFCTNNASDISSLAGRQGDINVDLAPVPLPAGMLLLLTGIGGLAAARRRKS